MHEHYNDGRVYMTHIITVTNTIITVTPTRLIMYFKVKTVTITKI